jgi:hypothetical protein
VIPGESETLRTRPDRPRGSPILLYSGCRVFPGGKAECYRVTFICLVISKFRFSLFQFLPLPLLLFLPIRVCRNSPQCFKAQWLSHVPTALRFRNSADLSEETATSVVRFDIRGYCYFHQRGGLMHLYQTAYRHKPIVVSSVRTSRPHSIKLYEYNCNCHGLVFLRAADVSSSLQLTLLFNSLTFFFPFLFLSRFLSHCSHFSLFPYRSSLSGFLPPSFLFLFSFFLFPSLSPLHFSFFLYLKVPLLTLPPPSVYLFFFASSYRIFLLPYLCLFLSLTLHVMPIFLFHSLCLSRSLYVCLARKIAAFL